MLARLSDDSPHVRRAAVDALGSTPTPANIRPLVEMRQRIDGGGQPPASTPTRIALRNQLRPADELEGGRRKRTSPEKDARVIADVVPGRAFAGVGGVPRGAPRGRRPTRPTGRRGSSTTRRGTRARTTRDSSSPGSGRATPRSSRTNRRWRRPSSSGTQERGAPLSKEASAWIAGLTETLLTSAQEGEVRLGIDLVGAGPARVVAGEARRDCSSPRRPPAPLRAAALTALGNLDVNRHAGDARQGAGRLDPADRTPRAGGDVPGAGQPAGDAGPARRGPADGPGPAPERHRGGPRLQPRGGRTAPRRPSPPARRRPGCSRSAASSSGSRRRRCRTSRNA